MSKTKQELAEEYAKHIKYTDSPNGDLVNIAHDWAAGYQAKERERDAELAQAKDAELSLGIYAGELEAQVERLREALRALVSRLDWVHAHPSYASVWQVSQLHVGPYTGPTYDQELEEAREALKQSGGTDE